MEEAFTADVVEALYGMGRGDTFAARIENNASTLGPRTEYCRVETIYDGIARDHDRIMKIEMRREPSVDYWIPNSIYETDVGGAEIRRLGPPNIMIHGVTEDVLIVDYSSDNSLKATCDECGRTGTVPVSEDDLPILNPILTEDGDGEQVTTCCYSEHWTSSVAIP